MVGASDFDGSSDGLELDSGGESQNAEGKVT